jgi:hypothetical protein
MNCQPSLLKDGSSTALRERLFTSWMSPAQLQDHMKRMAALGMVPLYSTFVPGAGFREIYWRPQVPVYFEVRSARTREQFLEFQRGNAARGWPLLTLHVSEPGDFHSAVWMDTAGHADARPVLEGLGIGLATVSEDGPS